MWCATAEKNVVADVENRNTMVDGRDGRPVRKVEHERKRDERLVYDDGDEMGW